MTAALFEEDVDTEAERRQIRQLALGGALQLIRGRRAWSVNDAAQHAGLAPMTWRRIEDGLTVRAASHTAVDRLLELPFGTVRRALNDDLMMVDIVKLTGTDVRHVATDNAAEFLADFARTTRKVGAVERLFTDPGALRMMHHPDGTVDVLDEHGQARTWRPSDLRLVGELIELLAPLAGQGHESIDTLLESLRAATPVLASAQLGGLRAHAGGTE
jgi:hypothetical protein